MRVSFASIPRRRALRLEDVLNSFVSMTLEPLGVGYRAPGSDTARHVWANVSCCQQFGYTLKELNDLSVLKLIAPHALDDFVAGIQPVSSNGRDHLSHETVFRRKNGAEFWGRLIVTFAPWNEHGDRYSMAIVQDHSQMKQLELREPEAFA